MVAPPGDHPPSAGCVLWLPAVGSAGETSEKVACSFSFISFTKLATWARHESGPAPGSDLGQAFIPSCLAWAQEGFVLREVSGVRAVSSRRLLCQVQQRTAPREGCRHPGVGAGMSEPI